MTNLSDKKLQELAEGSGNPSGLAMIAKSSSPLTKRSLSWFGTSSKRCNINARIVGSGATQKAFSKFRGRGRCTHNAERQLRLFELDKASRSLLRLAGAGHDFSREMRLYQAAKLRQVCVVELRGDFEGRRALPPCFESHE